LQRVFLAAVSATLYSFADKSFLVVCEFHFHVHNLFLLSHYRMLAFLNDSDEANTAVYTPKEEMKIAEILRRTAELDLAEAQLWYETQQSGLGAEFQFEVSQVIDRLSETPLIYQIIYQDVRRAIVRHFPYLIWYRVLGEVVTVLACTHGRQDPDKALSRFE